MEKKTGKIIKISRKGNINSKQGITMHSKESMQLSSSQNVALKSGGSILHDINDDIQDQPAGTTYVYLGIFFDGTGNNKYNVDQRKKGSIPTYRENDSDFASYFSNFSNVARLWNLYNKELKEDRNLGIKTYYTRAYVEGIGTKRGETDDMFGSGMGRWDRGVISKVKDGIKEIINSFNDNDLPIPKKYKKDRQGKTIPQIDKLVIDIFGFSRGAAAARHFANIIAEPFMPAREEIITYRSGDGPAQKLLKVSRKPPGGEFGRALEQAGFPLGDTSIEIRFIGLFDTVAAIASNAEIAPSVIGAVAGFHLASIPGAIIGGVRGITTLINASQNCDNGDVRLSLANVPAKKKVHLVANHEYRANFRLNDEATAHVISLPGAHSDIGGGYSEVTNEDYYKLSLTIKNHNPDPPQGLLDLREQYINNIDYLRGQIWVETKQVTRMIPTAKNLDRFKPIMETIYYHTLLGSKGKITDRYSLVCMEVMKKYAENAGVKWMTPSVAITKDTDRIIPASDYQFADDFLENTVLPLYLEHYFVKKTSFKTIEDLTKLKVEYIHTSSEYNNPLAGGLIYPNQPDQSGIRSVCKY